MTNEQNDKNPQSWDERVKQGKLPLARRQLPDAEDRILRWSRGAAGGTGRLAGARPAGT